MQTFETFVVSANNEFARDAAWTAAQAPGKSYNPLFIFGQPGAGKTHLLQAIAQHISSRQRNAKVIYNSGECFANEFIDAIQDSKLNKFREHYHQADVLLIDDIQFLCDMGRTQEEFLYAFNALYDAHKLIVLSGNRAPSEIGNLDARLVSCFEWGLTAEVKSPDVEPRIRKRRRRLF